MKNFFIVNVVSGSIFQTQLNLKKDYLNFFKKLKYQKLKGGTNRTYRSLDNNLFEKHPKELKELKKLINTSLKDLIKNTYMYDCNFRLTTSWATKADSFEESEVHCHSNSWLSGVFYPQDNNTISFDNKDMGYFIGSPRERNQYNSRNINVSTHKNTLLLFPSHLYHRIPSLDLKGVTRYSLAFNVLPKGSFGVSDSDSYAIF